MGITQLVGSNFDLLSVGISITGIALLGVLIYLNDRTSITNRTFLLFAMLTVVWGISNYLEYRFTTTTATLWALRVHICISVLHAYAFFRLAYVFPSTRIEFPGWYRNILTPVVAATALLTLTPFVFSGVTHLAPAGEVTNPSRGPGIALFSLVAFGLLITGVLHLYRKWRAAHDVERRQVFVFFLGMLLTAVLILLFNVFLPVMLNQLSFIPLAALFLLPIIGLTSYAIYRHHLFQLKVATTAFLGFMVTVFSFVNVLYSTDIGGIAINVTAFIVVLIGSIKIVQDTLDLVRQRELIQEQEQELEKANRQQESLLHFISHEIKGYLTKNAAVFDAIRSGDVGEVTPQLRDLSVSALADTRKGVDTVIDILDASNLKKGTVSYHKQSFDIALALDAIVRDLAPQAHEKGVDLSFHIPVTGPCLFTGDEDKIKRHVFRNIIDNSIKYTPSGSIKVDAVRSGARYRFTVTDTGVGITPDDMKRLFTEGGHGTDSIKVNAHSTGYGLYIAKEVVEAHGGKVWAESDGAGKGSRFVIELPVA
ncbi:hypothetical protein K8R03_04030 [Candidatus Kaiserbacteria bacterium]|nr:hypothetical protein [Candidatus Kaiserbacteria bacterium]